jgi:PAS domain S-box-containing protein
LTEIGAYALAGLLLAVAVVLALRGYGRWRRRGARDREFALIASHVRELMFRTDAHGTVTDANRRWQALLGAGVPVIGQPLEALVAPDERELVRRLFVPHEAGHNPARVAQVSIGGQRRFEVSVVPLFSRKGRLAGHVGSGVDVTERVEAQRRLAAELAFSAQLLELSPLPTSMLDARGCYLRVNQAWEQFTGRRREDVVGQPARGYLRPEEARQHDEVDRRLWAQGGQARYEATFRHADGQLRDLIINKAAVPGDDGRAAAILVVFLDVSELRGAERATRAARDLAEEASRAKSEFVANVSHELRTPLQSIIGFSELGTVRARAHEKLAAMFSDIHAAGQRMLALVNDLLDVARLESSVGTLHLERTDLRPLVREVLAELQPLLARRQLHVALVLSEAPLVAKVDPLRFQQVLRNVMANAIRFAPPGSTIDLVGDATVEDGAGHHHLSVRDRGPGIPEGELETIFDAFVQSSKTKNGAGGTGLGLAICRKIMAAHGGRIVAQNAEPEGGGGSRFHLWLPSRGFADTTIPADL